MKIRILAIVLSLMLLIIGLPWLIVGVAIISEAFIITRRRPKWFCWIMDRYPLKFIFSLLIITVGVILFRVFLFEVYSVPTASMEDSILAGDKILVSKLSYGPTIPQSPFEIPWVNTLFFLFDNTSTAKFTNWWPYSRLSGYSEIKLNDIVVFSMDSKKQQYVKRCVGLPGDTIRFIDGNCSLNSMRFTFSPTSKRYYDVWVNNSKSFCEYLTNNGISRWKEESSKFTVLLTQPVVATINSLSNVNSIQITPMRKIHNDFFLKIDSSWTVDNLGPYFIPKKGTVITLNSNTYNLYKYIINQYEGVTLVEKDDGFYLGNIKIQSYTFIQNYYFMIGDNISNSMDSRCWGLVPESAVKGKAVVVLFSNTDGVIGWHRLLTTL